MKPCTSGTCGAAAYLIGGGCSDDSFMDFRAGLIALGHDWYQRAAACPDALAAHPAVNNTRAPCGEDIFDEKVNYAAPRAFQHVTGEEETFYHAFDAYRASHGKPEQGDADMGEDFDFDDPDEMQRRLPRLIALYLGHSVAK
ncbi:DUF4240 domain-containing protein [Streptomyces sp. NPDC020965]|uniref:DUF4240 domain-containing protein n=1 Tax=Streptomyces sp. NPDC020965 TaxID=3365105 RepID=UPI00379006CA